MFLKAHPNIVITKSDKTSNTVIIEKSLYNEKMTDILRDETTYKALDQDPTEK